MKIKYQSETCEALIICANAEEFRQVFHQLEVLRAAGAELFNDRALPDPKLEVRAGEILVLTFDEATFASIPIQSVTSNTHDGFEEKQVSHPSANVQSINAWWAKNRDTMVRKFLEERHLIPTVSAGNVNLKP